MVSPATLECRSRGTDSGPSRGEARSSPPGHARRAGGRRLARWAPVRAGILPSPGTCHPPCLLFSWAVAGAIPSLSTSRSGARPRCLNHCEAAFSAKEPAHRRMRGGQVRSALQEGNLGEERVLNPRYPRPLGSVTQVKADIPARSHRSAHRIPSQGPEGVFP
jgi:hypothetical protein